MEFAADAAGVLLRRRHENIGGKGAEDRDGSGGALEVGVVEGAVVEQDGPGDDGGANGLAQDCGDLKWRLQIGEAIEAAQSGFARIPAGLLREGGEESLAREGVTVRCLVAPDMGLPKGRDDADAVAVVGRAY